MSVYKRSSSATRRRFIIGAAFLCIAVFAVWSISVWSRVFGWGQRRLPVSSAPVAALSDTGSATSTVERFLDGAEVPPEMASGTLYAAMIDNAPDAGQRAGIENAPLVVEAPVEGGISRLLAFFLTGESVDAVGPIRSARPYFIDFAKMFGALYVHVGGAPAALDALTGMAWNVDQYAQGNYFWRSETRVSPHNVFTSSERMASLASKKKIVSAYKPLWFFSDEPSAGERGGGSVLSINFGVTSVEWRYNQTENRYERSVYGAPETTVDEHAITAANVVVLSTSVSVLDTAGRLDVKTVGSGKALFLQNGKSIDGTWQRLEAGGPLKFFDASGNEMRLTRGTVWIEVVGDGVVWSNN